MVSKKELAGLLRKSLKPAAAKAPNTASSGSRTVITIKPIRSVPPVDHKRKMVEDREEGPVADSPVIDLTPSSPPPTGKGVAEGSAPPAQNVGAGSYASPSFSGVGLPLPVPIELDARLMDEDKEAYLKNFPAATLFKQVKGMAVYTALVLKFFESGSAWDDSIKLEKERLTRLVEKKVADLQATFNQDAEVLKKAKVDAKGRAAEAGRLKEEEAAKVTLLTEQLASAKEEARVAKEALAKKEEDLAAKSVALAELETKLATVQAEKDSLGDAVMSTWVNSQEQIKLAVPNLDLSWMSVDGWADDDDLWRLGDDGEAVKVQFPSPGSS